MLDVDATIVDLPSEPGGLCPAASTHFPLSFDHGALSKSSAVLPSLASAFTDQTILPGTPIYKMDPKDAEWLKLKNFEDVDFKTFETIITLLEKLDRSSAMDITYEMAQEALKRTEPSFSEIFKYWRLRRVEGPLVKSLNQTAPISPISPETTTLNKVVEASPPIKKGKVGRPRKKPLEDGIHTPTPKVEEKDNKSLDEATDSHGTPESSPLRDTDIACKTDVNKRKRNRPRKCCISYDLYDELDYFILEDETPSKISAIEVKEEKSPCTDNNLSHSFRKKRGRQPKMSCLSPFGRQDSSTLVQPFKRKRGRPRRSEGLDNGNVHHLPPKPLDINKKEPKDNLKCSANISSSNAPSASLKTSTPPPPKTPKNLPSQNIFIKRHVGRPKRGEIVIKRFLPKRKRGRPRRYLTSQMPSSSSNNTLKPVPPSNNKMEERRAKDAVTSKASVVKRMSNLEIYNQNEGSYSNPEIFLHDPFYTITIKSSSFSAKEANPCNAIDKLHLHRSTRNFPSFSVALGQNHAKRIHNINASIDPPTDENVTKSTPLHLEESNEKKQDDSSKPISSSEPGKIELNLHSTKAQSPVKKRGRPRKISHFKGKGKGIPVGLKSNKNLEKEKFVPNLNLTNVYTTNSKCDDRTAKTDTHDKSSPKLGVQNLELKLPPKLENKVSNDSQNDSPVKNKTQKSESNFHKSTKEIFTKKKVQQLENTGDQLDLKNSPPSICSKNETKSSSSSQLDKINETSPSLAPRYNKKDSNQMTQSLTPIKRPRGRPRSKTPRPSRNKATPEKVTPNSCIGDKKVINKAAEPRNKKLKETVSSCLSLENKSDTSETITSNNSFSETAKEQSDGEAPIDSSCKDSLFSIIENIHNSSSSPQKEKSQTLTKQPILVHISNSPSQEKSKESPTTEKREKESIDNPSTNSSETSSNFHNLKNAIIEDKEKILQDPNENSSSISPSTTEDKDITTKDGSSETKTKSTNEGANSDKDSTPLSPSSDSSDLHCPTSSRSMPPKRPRGRPRIKPLPPFPVPKRPRGRPRTKPLTPVLPPRPRGRPNKNDPNYPFSTPVPREEIACEDPEIMNFISMLDDTPDVSSANLDNISIPSVLSDNGSFESNDTFSHSTKSLSKDSMSSIDFISTETLKDGGNAPDREDDSNSHNPVKTIQSFQGSIGKTTPFGPTGNNRDFCASFTSFLNKGHKDLSTLDRKLYTVCAKQLPATNDFPKESSEKGNNEALLIISTVMASSSEEDFTISHEAKTNFSSLSERYTKAENKVSAPRNIEISKDPLLPLLDSLTSQVANSMYEELKL